MNNTDYAELLFPLLSTSRLRIGTDGSGVTTLVAGAGCPLQCRRCINKKILEQGKADLVTPETLLEKLKIDDLYFRATGGGITFGGGEPLIHAAFISRFREICPAEWKIRVETSLAVSVQSVELIASAADEFIVDCKDLDSERYHSYTGGDVSLMLNNLILLRDLVGPERIVVRVPRIPEYNTVANRDENVKTLLNMGFYRIDKFEYV